MAFAAIGGQGAWALPTPPLISSRAFSSSVIDATGEKVAWMGRVWTPNFGAKSIRKIGVVFGTVTKAGGSACTMSLQNLSTAAGAPMVPDETQDETVAIANADAGFATGLAYETGNLSADRAVNHGDPLAVVLEYDGSGRLSSDVVNVVNAGRSLIGGAPSFPAVALKTASWAAVGVAPNIWFVFSDGTYGTLQGAFPCFNAAGTLSFKQDTAVQDEYAIEIPVLWDCKVIGLWAICGVAATTSDFEFVLYDGTTAMTGGTVTHDGMWVSAINDDRYMEVPFSQEIELAAGTTYRLAMKPTQTTSNVRLGYFDTPSAGVMGLAHGGAGFIINSRLDAGAWLGTTATRRPFMGLIVSAWADGAGGGGGMLVNPGMSGRLV